MRAEYEEYVIPDVTAAFGWLNNRRPDDWRQSRHTKGGNDPGAGDTYVNIDARTIVTERLSRMSKSLNGGEAPVIDANADQIKEMVVQMMNGLSARQENSEVEHDGASTQS